MKQHRYGVKQGKTLALAYAKEYRQWVEHLINYRMWDTWDCVANELRMVDRKRDIAGSLDAVLQHKETGVLCLADFKTQFKYKKKNHRLQIGGYVSLLNQNYPSITLFTCKSYLYNTRWHKNTRI